MDASDCKTSAHRDVLTTYRRVLRRRGMDEFHAIGLALAEEIGAGAVLAPEWVERVSGGTRTLDERGRLRLTSAGVKVLLSTVETEAAS